MLRYHGENFKNPTYKGKAAVNTFLKYKRSAESKQVFIVLLFLKRLKSMKHQHDEEN